MSWNDFMKRLVIGKKREKGFSSQDLPHNRKQVFKFIYKNRLIEQFNAGLLAIIFFIPLFVWQLLNESLKSSFDLKNLDQMAIYEKYLGLLTTRNFINVPCVMLASLGFAGLVYVIRKLCFNEPVSVFKDFFKGIKNSWFQYLVIGFIFGSVIYLIDWAFNYIIYYPSLDGAVKIGLTIFMALLLFTIIVAFIYAYFIAGLYKTSATQIVKGSIFLTFKKFSKSILLFLSAVLPIMICFIVPILLIKIIGVFVLVFGGLSFATIVASLFSYAKFDDYINSKSYPELVKKGIYQEEDILEEDMDNVTQDEIEKLAEAIAKEYDEESIE